MTPTRPPFPELAVERAHLGFSRALPRPDDRAVLGASTPRRRPTRSPRSTSRSPSPRRWRTCARRAPATSSAGSPRSGRLTARRRRRWYIGRRHIEDERHDPVVVDWRAPIAAPFYRATHVDPFGLAHRRRFTLADGELTAYLDEHLDDPDARRGRPASPTPCWPRSARPAPARCARSSPPSRPSRTWSSARRSTRCWSCRAAPAPARPRSACTAPRTCCSSTAAGSCATACWWSARTGCSSTTSPTCCRRSASAACSSAPRSSCACRRWRSPASTSRRRAALQGHARRCSPRSRPPSIAHVQVPDEDVRVPLGARTLVFTPDEIAGWIAAGARRRARR